MGRETGVRLEKDQIALLEVASHHFAADMKLLAGGARQADFKIAEDLLGEAGAVQGLAAVAAEAVTRAKEAVSGFLQRIDRCFVFFQVLCKVNRFVDVKVG